MNNLRANIKKPAVKFFVFVILLDLVLLLMKVMDYYVELLVGIGFGFLYPVLLTLVSFFLVANTLKIQPYVVVLISVFGILFALGLWLAYLVAEFSVDRVESPNGEAALIIEHRDVTLGETRHIYHFYRPTALPGVLKKLTEEPVSFYIHYHLTGGDPDALKALGVEQAQWFEDRVIFYSERGEIEVDLKH